MFDRLDNVIYLIGQWTGISPSRISFVILIVFVIAATSGLGFVNLMVELQSWLN